MTSSILLTLLKLNFVLVVLRMFIDGQGEILPQCKEGSKLVGETCFHFNSSRVSWYQARNNCESDGMILAYVISLQQTREILDVYPITSLVWIGASDRKQEGEFIWVASNEYATELEGIWEAGEPNDANKNENCVALYTSSKVFDKNCGFKYPYLCMEQMCPYNLKIERVSGQEVVLSWKPGFNGGQPQTFTVQYLDLGTNISHVTGKVTATRADQTSSRVIKYPLEGLSMKTPYIIYIIGSISNGTVECTPLIVTTETTDDIIPKCKEERSKLVGETCFHFNLSPATWYQAKRNCESNGMILAYVSSLNQTKEILKDEHLKDRVWIGASDIQKEGEFIWVASNENATELEGLWEQGEPNNIQRDQGDEDCVNILPTFHANDDLCTFPCPYLCMETSCPYNIKVERTFNDKVTFTWKPGFHGGPPLTLTIEYQDLMRNLSQVAGNVTVPRVDQTASRVIKYTIDGLSMRTPYKIYIHANISNGTTECKPLIITTETTAENQPSRTHAIAIAIPIGIIGLALGAFLLYLLFKKGTTGSVISILQETPLPHTDTINYQEIRDLDESINTRPTDPYDTLNDDEIVAVNVTDAGNQSPQDEAPTLPFRPNRTKPVSLQTEALQHRPSPLTFPRIVTSDNVQLEDNLQLEEDSEQYLIPVQIPQHLKQNMQIFSITTDYDNKVSDADLPKPQSTNRKNENGHCACEPRDGEQKGTIMVDGVLVNSSPDVINYHTEGPRINEERLNDERAYSIADNEDREKVYIELNNYSFIGASYADHQYLKFTSVPSHSDQLNMQGSDVASSATRKNIKPVDSNSFSILNDYITPTDGENSSCYRENSIDFNASPVGSDYITPVDRDINSSDADENYFEIADPNASPQIEYITAVDRDKKSSDAYDNYIELADYNMSSIENTYILPVNRDENTSVSGANDIENADSNASLIGSDYITPVDRDTSSSDADENYIELVDYSMSSIVNDYIKPVDRDECRLVCGANKIELADSKISKDSDEKSLDASYIVFDGAENTENNKNESSII